MFTIHCNTSDTFKLVYPSYPLECLLIDVAMWYIRHSNLNLIWYIMCSIRYERKQASKMPGADTDLSQRAQTQRGLALTNGVIRSFKWAWLPVCWLSHDKLKSCDVKVPLNAVLLIVEPCSAEILMLGKCLQRFWIVCSWNTNCFISFSFPSAGFTFRRRGCVLLMFLTQLTSGWNFTWITLVNVTSC